MVSVISANAHSIAAPTEHDAWSTRIPHSLSPTRSVIKWRGDTTASKWVPQDHLLPLDTANVDDMKSEYFSKQLEVSRQRSQPRVLYVP